LQTTPVWSKFHRRRGNIFGSPESLLDDTNHARPNGRGHDKEHS
jgi:hypothetical protein